MDKKRFLFLGKIMPLCSMALFDKVTRERMEITERLPFSEWTALLREERPNNPWVRTAIKYQLPKAISA